MSANTSNYMVGAAWRELDRSSVRGRPALVWRQRPQHLLDLLDLSAGRDDLYLLVQGPRRISFGAFRHTVEFGAAALKTLGVRPGDRVLIVLFNSPEFLLAQWSAWRLGAVPVLGNRWWSGTDLAAAALRIMPSLIVTDMATPEFARPSSPTVSPAEIANWWGAAPEFDRAADPRLDSREDDIALIEFTAGSSGAPKAVVLSHRNLIWTPHTIHNIRKSRPPAPASANEQTVALMTTPMFHNGAVVAGLGALVDGNRIVMPQGKFNAEEVLTLIQKERVTSWSAVPTMFSSVLRHPDFANYDLSSLVALATGGAAVSMQMLDELKQRLPSATAGFTSGYGMTEMSFLTMVTAAQLQERPGTVGKAVPGVEIRVSPPDANGEGELQARNAALMVNYFDGEEPPIDDEGWYHTGDLGRIDPDGFVYITGRAKDMVIRGGENISCPRVESILGMHPQVIEVAVVGYPDVDFGEALAAIVHVKSVSSSLPNELRDYSRQLLAYFEVPSRWVCVNTPLPVLPTGKIDKRRLQRELSTSTANNGA